METPKGVSPQYLEVFNRHLHLLVPQRPSWIMYATDKAHLTDDPTGETHETFMDRLNLRLDEDDLGTVEDAYLFSKFGHRGQTRANGERYFNHLRSSTLIAIDELEIYDVLLIVCDLLHDIKEERRFLRAAMIKSAFGSEAMYIVNLLSKDERTKLIYFERLIASAKWRALLIKCLDRAHNMRTLHYMKHHKIPEQIAETRDEFPAVLEALSKCIPGEYAHVVPYLRKMLEDLCIAHEELHNLLPVP